MSDAKGAELDMLAVEVAEKVMGWKAWIDLDDDTGTYRCFVQRPRGRPFEKWDGATNIAHAWEVVERLMERRYTWQADGHGGHSSFHFLDSGSHVAGSVAPTLPHAICLAALKAAGE